MKINIDTHLLALQLAFSERFPHLKIAFYKNAHDRNELSPIAEEVFRDYTIGEINPDFKEADFLLDEFEKVSEFEERIEKLCGLHVQVLRKSGQTWIQTSVTDDWTLKKQEEHAH